MTVTKEQLRADLRSAMLAKQAARVRMLRTLLTAVAQAEVAGTEAVELDADQLIAVIAAQAKRRREAIEEYERAGRADLVAKESEEAEVLAGYLPAPLTAAEITEQVAGAIAELGVAGEGLKAMGRVMGVLTPRLRGRVDGKALSDEVRRQLAG